jgi:methylglutaconyl-CoA hydratase
MTTLSLNIKNSIATITLMREEKRNAINAQMILELKKCLQDLRLNPAILIVVITGSGSVFSAGADLESLEKISSNSFDANLDDSNSLRELFEMIHTLSKITVAKINGHAIAGGCGLASVCDITIAKRSAKLGYTEVKIGFIAAIVMVFLQELVGDKKAVELLLSGRLISADEAERIGLISLVLDDDNFDRDCDNYLQELSSNSPSAMIETKHLYQNVRMFSHEYALGIAANTNAKVRTSDDCKEGVRAFLEKRKPIWKPLK